jgi:hypothetical protein
MKKFALAALLTVLFAAACQGAEAPAAPNSSAEKGADSPAAQAMGNYATAEQLAALGRTQKSALQIAAAAQILSASGAPAESGAQKVTIGVGEAEQTDVPSRKTGKPETLTAEALYAEAIALAKEGGDAALAETIERQSRIGGTKGAGYQLHYDMVLAYSQDVYTVTYSGGSSAVARVTGDGDRTMLYVYDEYGNFIGSDTDYSTRSTVRWTPRWTGPFRLVVKNPNGVYVDYKIETN